MNLTLVKSDQPRNRRVPAWLGGSAATRLVNIEARARGAVPTSGRIRFLCECGTAGCDEPVFLSAAVFDALLGSGTGRVLPGSDRPCASRPPLELHSASRRVEPALSAGCGHDESTAAGEAA